MCAKHCLKARDYLLTCTTEGRTVRCNHRDNINIANAFFCRIWSTSFIITSVEIIDTFQLSFVISILCRSTRNISFCIGFALKILCIYFFYKRKKLNNINT